MEAAAAAIGSALIDPGVMDELALRLSPGDFYVPKHALIWTALLEMHRAGKPIDVVLLNEELARRGVLERVGGSAGLAELTEKVPTSANAAYYADTVQRTADLNRLIQAAAAVQDWARSAPPRTTPGEVQAQADRLVRSVLPDRAPSGVPLGRFASDVIDKADRGEQPVVWTTGFADLDERLGGGLRPGLLTLVAARPSMGKTALLTRIARNVAWHAVGVSLFSLEVSGASVATNMLAAETRLPGRAIAAGAISDDEREAVRRARDNFARVPITVHEGRRWRFGELVAAIRHDVRRLGTKVVAIDYLQLIDPDAEGRSRAEEVGAVSRELKLLALDLGVSVVAAAQLSREIEKRKDKWPQMADLRESGSLEQDADNILLLHRPGYYEPTKDDLRGLAHVDVVKQRDGPPGVVDLEWVAECMRFQDQPRRDRESAAARLMREARERQAVGAAAGSDE